MTKTMESDLVDPLDRRPIGNIAWLSELTGWRPEKISRLAREGVIPGAFKAVETKGSVWSFRKAKVIAWLEGRTTR
jgi:hypothetical protein